MRGDWPDDDVLAALAVVPPGARLRSVRRDERHLLPERLLAWYPTVAVGAESVFLDPAWLDAQVAFAGDAARDVFVLWIERDGAAVGLMSFERERAAATLHGRVGALDPAARVGALGALGFPVFEAVGRWLGAELLSVWVTLASRTQQVMAERRGFRLCGVVPGFDRDAVGGGRTARVTEALYTTLLTDEPPWLPEDSALTPRTRAALHALGVGPVRA